MKYGFYLLLILLSALELKVNAQEQAFTVRINHDTVSTGQVFKVEFEILNIQGVFTPPDFSPFEVQAGPNTSSSFSMINGKVTQKMTYTYFLIATDSGNFTLPSAAVQSDNELINSSELNIVVIPADENAQRSRQSDIIKEYRTDIQKKEEENVKPKRKKRRI